MNQWRYVNGPRNWTAHRGPGASFRSGRDEQQHPLICKFLKERGHGWGVLPWRTDVIISRRGEITNESHMYVVDPNGKKRGTLVVNRAGEFALFKNGEYTTMDSIDFVHELLSPIPEA